MTTIAARVGGSIVFERDTPAKAEVKLARAFSFANSVYFRLQNMGRNMDYSNVPDRIKGAFATPDGLIIPRGGVALVRKTLTKAGFVPEWIDERTRGREITIPHASYPTVQLRPFQKEALATIQKKKQGLVIIGCGGGKTTIGVCVTERFRLSTVVLVHTGDLLEQWIERFDELLGIKAGRVADGKFEPADVTIAMIQTLSIRLREGDPEAKKLLDEAGIVMLDEAHHAPADMFRSVLDHAPGVYRVGFTATPKREDGQSKIVQWCFGETLIDVSTKELLRLGYLMRPGLELLETDFEFRSTTVDKFKRAHELATYLEGYEPRKHAIASVVAHHAKQGETVLVLANRKPYARDLGRLIWSHGVECYCVTGETAKKARKNLIKEFRKGEKKVLVATSLANEGLDAPGLSRIVMAWPESSRGGTDQKTGRLMRLAQKVPLLIDVIDPKCRELMRRYRDRCVSYRSLGMNPPSAKAVAKCDL